MPKFFEHGKYGFHGGVIGRHRFGGRRRAVGMAGDQLRPVGNRGDAGLAANNYRAAHTRSRLVLRADGSGRDRQHQQAKHREISEHGKSFDQA